ncbi:hypothetical protein PN416_17170 [Halorubrum ezzemoulense]|nr:hypothetical protein [Halorubrum ezzemoulense]
MPPLVFCLLKNRPDPLVRDRQLRLRVGDPNLSCRRPACPPDAGFLFFILGIGQLNILFIDEDSVRQLLEVRRCPAVEPLVCGLNTHRECVVAVHLRRIDIQRRGGLKRLVSVVVNVNTISLFTGSCEITLSNFEV